MIVLGIDPGTVATGYGVVAVSGSRHSCLDAGDIRASAALPMEQRLRIIHDKVAELIAHHQPDAVAVEDAFVAKNPQTALKLGQARGVVLLAAASAGLPVANYTPTHVKQSVVGYGRADKEQVIFMITRLLNLPEPPKSDHAADALGLALCHLQKGRYDALAAKAGAS